MKMKSPIIPLRFFFLFYVSTPLFEDFNNGDGGFKLEEKEEPHIKRSDFPLGFLFGVATSGYQVDNLLFLTLSCSLSYLHLMRELFLG